MQVLERGSVLGGHLIYCIQRGLEILTRRDYQTRPPHLVASRHGVACVVRPRSLNGCPLCPAVECDLGGEITRPDAALLRAGLQLAGDVDATQAGDLIQVCKSKFEVSEIYWRFEIQSLLDLTCKVIFVLLRLLDLVQPGGAPGEARTVVHHPLQGEGEPRLHRT